jgi:hypothetical protein
LLAKRVFLAWLASRGTIDVERRWHPVRIVKPIDDRPTALHAAAEAMAHGLEPRIHHIPAGFKTLPVAQGNAIRASATNEHMKSS